MGYNKDLKALQERLVAVQSAYMRTGRRAIIVFEGHDAAGKGGTIRRLTASLDPRFYKVWPVAAPDEEERSHHYLWRFWRRMPPDGTMCVFDRSWYGRVLVERVEGLASETEWSRAYGEINHFEALLASDGARVVKLFMDVDAETQDKRFLARFANPAKHWKLSQDDFRNRSRRADYEAAIDDMLAKTGCSQAPWVRVDGRKKKKARLAAIGAILHHLEDDVSLEPPPLDQEIVRLATEAFGTSPLKNVRREP
ncbi:polyphosphate kinase 2 family protein [Pacificimonas sp. ICDLI1SI03]